MKRAAGDFLYGATGFEFAHTAKRMRRDTGTLLLLVTFGDSIGLPVLPPYFSLRLLPYVMPELAEWRRHVLRERQPLEDEEYDLIEM